MTKSKYTLHEHYRKRMKRSHWDLRILRPDKKKAWSFALPKEKVPERGQKLLAIRTPDHKLGILNFEGTIDGDTHSSSGDTITILEKGECDIVKDSSSHISIIFKGKKLKGLFGFIYLRKDQWLLISAK